MSIPIIHAGPTVGKTTLCKRYPKQFFDPEDAPGFKTNPEYVKLRKAKPWRKNYHGWETDLARLNAIYAEHTVEYMPKGAIIVSNMAASDAWCKAVGGKRYATFFRPARDIFEASKVRGDNIPFEHCVEWYDSWCRDVEAGRFKGELIFHLMKFEYLQDYAAELLSHADLIRRG